MKVLVWVTKFPAFSETFIRDHIVGLLEEGVEVLIHAKDGQVNTSELKALEGFESQKLLDLVVDVDTYFRVDRFQRLKAALVILSRGMFGANRKYYLRALNVFKFRAQARSLRLLFRVHFFLKQGIDIVHAHYGPNGVLASNLKQVGLPIKLYATFHGYDMRMGMEKGGHIYDELFKVADGLIAISNYNEHNLLSFGAQKRTVIRLPNGVDVNAFKRTSPNTMVNATIKLLTVARLVDEKAIHIALKAIARAQKEVPQMKLEYTLLGDGPNRDALQDLVKKLSMEEQVHFKGNVSSLEVRNAMKTHNIFILSSEAEALPTVLLEAQAAGMVVLATDVGSVKDMVVAGKIVKPNDVDSMAHVLLELIERYEEWEGFAKKGTEAMTATYNWKKIMKKLLNHYKA